MEYLSQLALQASAIVLLIEEILKLKIVPLRVANRYPALTNVILSILVSAFYLDLNWTLENIGALAVQIGTVAVVAGLAYNQLVSHLPTDRWQGESLKKD